MRCEIKKSVVVGCGLVLVGAMGIACGSSTTPTTPTATVTAPTSSTIIVVSVPATLSLDVGDTSQLKAIATLQDRSSYILANSATWTSSNPSVATVNESGIVTAVGIGSANVVVTAGGISGTVAVTVSAAGAETRTLLGTVAGPDTVSGTVSLSFISPSRLSGNVYFANEAIALLGRFDEPTGMVQAIGGGFTFAGKLSDRALSGNYTDASGTNGGFTALDSTHTAVITFCGAYSSDSTTPLENPDAGAFSLETAVDGSASGESLPADASRAPLTFTGTRDGATLTMITSQGRNVVGTIQSGTATGTFETAGGATATFNATTGACR